MNLTSIQRVYVALTIAAALSAQGCSDKPRTVPNANAPVGTTVEADPRAKVLGVATGGPAAETAGTTSAAKSDITKAQQGSAMPMPGQANDHSTLDPKPTQKAAPTGR
jgi:hypothetical protein